VRGKKKMNICTRKKKGVAFGGTLTDLDPEEYFSSTWMLAVEVLGNHHHDPGHHLELGFSF
jgi:hypothetical protein